MKKLLLLLFLIPNLVMGESYNDKSDKNWYCKNDVYMSKNEYSAKKIYGICMNQVIGTKKTKKFKCIQRASNLVTNYGQKNFMLIA